MQAKKPQYDIYTSMMDAEIKQMRQLLGASLDKDASRGAVLEELFKRVPQFARTLSIHIYAEEYFWLRTGANIVFPASVTLLDTLHTTPFDQRSVDAFQLPFQSFMVSIPCGYRIDDLRIPSFLVTCIPYHETQELITSPFARLTNQQKGIFIRLEDSPPDDVSISIAYRDPIGQAAYARTHISTRQIPELLGVQVGEESHKQLRLYPNYQDVSDLSEYDMQIQKAMLRLVIGLGAHTLNKNVVFSAGFPGGREPKMIGKLPDTYRGMTLSLK
ncbi:hypothetical protein RBE51_18295 [Pseudomonas taiwanensis]|uniref:hypothetical protein n=1 Tax=Pseudomonas taiwanensis TaxID=470150 RepID=UPI0028DE94AD|nr:hypothetical protein [Pseudomonas taiwanensis]MDT8924747.1 hypothetical protein [Pseudomonas taiwanensis]